MVAEQRFRLLLVCTANECRSAFAVSTFSGEGVAADWVMASAGTEAVPGTAACVETGLADGSHQSQGVARDLVLAADLVLAMERMHRTRVAEVAPAGRSRAFTLVEAARFAEIVADSLERSAMVGDFRAQPVSGWDSLSPTAKLRWLVGEMHEARSYFDPIAGDIPDAHGDNCAPHQQVFSEIESGVNRFALAVERVLAARGIRN